MRTVTLSAASWKWVVLGSVSIALALLVFALVGSRSGLFFVYWGRYTAYLTRLLRRSHVWTSGAYVAGIQVLVFVGLASLALFGLVPYATVVLAVAAVGPAIYCERLVRKRLEKIESTADVFFMALANALKSTPSLGGALATVSSLMDGPVSEEFQIVVKETRLGKSLEDALRSAGARVARPRFGTGLAALLIGRQVGGNLPKVLETTAATLRELERLEGVVRQKTAEGRMQLWALGLLPIGLTYMLNQFDAHYFDPMFASLVGKLICLFAGVCYVSALLIARKVLAVDI